LRSAAAHIPNLVTTYDVILRNPTAAERLRPEVVLCVGEWPTSKVLRGWIEGLDATVWLATNRPDNRDALHVRTRVLPAALHQVAAPQPAVTAGGYARIWLRYEQQARAAIEGQFAATQEFVEPHVVEALARALPERTPLVVANSMPIRDVEYFWPANDRYIRVLCNRGANGIDGTLSTALGVAEASGRPTVLLTGDLALLHDTNGFLIGAKSQASLTIVLINNAGGGIFEHLPIAQFEPFEEFFATPQKVDFARLAAAYGVAHTLVADRAALRTAIGDLPREGIRVLEIRTDRKRDAAWRQRIFREVAAGLS
jgi:2-succinyl-5-enolpyruvyl-6-hydroxy-3-cyclohexene-1-carboxylate synthase